MGLFTNYIAEKEKNGPGPLKGAVSQPAAGTNDGTEQPGMFKDYLAGKSSADSPAAAPAAAEDPSMVDKAMPFVPKLEAMGQGAALGFGNRLNSELQAGMGAVDQTVNGSNNFGDQSAPDASLWTRAVDAISNFGANRKRAEKGVREDIQKLKNDHPVATALDEIAASIPATVLGGSILKGAGMTSNIAQATSLGGLYSYGASDKQGGAALKDAAVGGAISGATAGLLEAGSAVLKNLGDAPIEDLANAEYSNYGKPIMSIAKAEVKETPYGLDFKPKLGESFKIGQEMKSVLTDPNVQAEVTQELNHQPEVIQGIIDATKERLGQAKLPILAQHGHITTDADPILNKAFEIANGVNVKGNEVNEKAKDALLEVVKNIGQSMKTSDPIAGTAGKATLQQLSDNVQGLGETIFRDKAFDSSPGVKRAATRIWGHLVDSTSKLDQTEGSGGVLKDINQVFKAMYGMEEDMLKGTTVKAMVNPQNVGAENKFGQFVKHFEDLPANLRQELAPEMHDYLADQFPKVFAKAKTMVAATGASGGGMIDKLFSLAGLRAIKPINVANRLGQLSNMQMDLPQAPTGLGGAAQQGLNMAAPSIGGQLGPQRGGPQ